MKYYLKPNSKHFMNQNSIDFMEKSIEITQNLEFRIYNRLFQIVLLMIYKNCTIYS